MLQLSTPGPSSSASAHQLLKDSYARTLRQALGLSLGLLTLVFLAWPPVTIRPYRLKVDPIELSRVEVAESSRIVTRATVTGLTEAAMAPAIAIDEFLDTTPPLMPMTDLGMEAPVLALPRPPGESFLAFESQPVLRTRGVPQYPEIARELGLRGKVVVNVLIGTDGRVLQAIVIESAHPILDRSALQAARESTFEPARQRDVPVPVWVTLPYDFKMF